MSDKEGFAPGALLGGLAEELTASFRPLLPEENANKADVELAYFELRC